MAAINTKTAGASMQVMRFGGIDRRAPSRIQNGVCTAEDICNLRVGDDGAIRRRCGYSHRLTLPASVRSLWTGMLDGVETVIAAAGSQLYRLDPESGDYTAVGSLSTGEGEVCTLFCGGKLYVFDEQQILCLEGDSLTAARPYVPHVAQRRRQLDRYTTHEQPNLLTRSAIFSFIAEGESGLFYFGCRIASIDAVYNVTQRFTYYASEWSMGDDLLGNQFLQINRTPAADNEIVVQVTLAESDISSDRIASCRRGATYGGTQDNRIFLWDNGVRSEMFCSIPVTDAQIAFGEMHGVETGELYFTAEGHFLVGDGRHAVTDVCRHYDRLLIYTEADTWMADCSSGDIPRFPVVPINSGVGCGSPHGAALAGNDPLTAAAGKVWRWHSSALRRDECSAEAVSAGIEAMFGAAFSAGTQAYSHRPRGEVWFTDPSGGTGEVFIYREEAGIWYRFTGIRADGLFGFGGEVGFWRGADIFLFDEEIDTDLDTDGEHEIAASLTLGGLDFGAPERYCRTTRMALFLGDEYGELTLCCTTDLGRRTEIRLPPGGSMGGLVTLDRPLRTGRFRRLTLSMSANARDWPTLRGITLCTAEASH
ncbi:MAG: hypothetical protein IJC15_08805 [Clostridia bacterium]|nr:hypothetical protein [Clostridia bacterium]